MIIGFTSSMYYSLSSICYRLFGGDPHAGIIPLTPFIVAGVAAGILLA